MCVCVFVVWEREGGAECEGKGREESVTEGVEWRKV